MTATVSQINLLIMKAKDDPDDESIAPKITVYKNTLARLKLQQQKVL